MIFGNFVAKMVFAIIISAITYAAYACRRLAGYRKLFFGEVVISIAVAVVLVSRDVVGVDYPINPDQIHIATAKGLLFD